MPVEMTLSENDESLLAIANKGDKEVLYLLTTRLKQLRWMGREAEATQLAIKLSNIVAPRPAKLESIRVD